MKFRKADHLITNKQIMIAPSCSASSAYTSLSETSGHHNTIITSVNNEIKCDCRMFKTHHICSHAVASAHLNGCLYGFIRFHRRKYKSLYTPLQSFTRTINADRAGLKDNQRIRKRKANSKEAPGPSP